MVRNSDGMNWSQFYSWSMHAFNCLAMVPLYLQMLFMHLNSEIGFKNSSVLLCKGLFT